LGVNQSNVRQLNVHLYQMDSADYTPWTSFPRVSIPRQDRQIRLPHLLHFTSAVATAATIAGRGNQCVSAQTVRNRLWGAVLSARLRTLVVPFVHQRNLTLQCSGQRKATCRTGVLRFSSDAQSRCSPMVSVLTNP
jgi:hypothetical protein